MRHERCCSRQRALRSSRRQRTWGPASPPPLARPAATLERRGLTSASSVFSLAGWCRLGLRFCRLLLLIAWPRIHSSRPPRERGIVPAQLGPSFGLSTVEEGRSCPGYESSSVSSQLNRMLVPPSKSPVSFINVVGVRNTSLTALFDD